MDEEEDLRPAIKLWLEKDENPIAGEGRIELLRTVEEEGSLNKAAKKLDMSYRHVWGVIKKLEERLGFDLVESTKGGVKGGGTKLTEDGKDLAQKYTWIRNSLEDLVNGRPFWRKSFAEISFKNHLRGKVTKIEKGETGVKVKVEIGPGEIKSFITKEAADDLELSVGDKIEAVVKATEVNISK